MIRTMIGLVDRGFLGANIVRPDWIAGALSTFSDEAATSEEIDKSWKVVIQELDR